MTRIGSIGRLGTDQLRALNRIGQLGRAITQNKLRLSTLKRINSAKDDPSGLVSVSLLERELAATSAAAKSVTRASAILNTADSTAGEILTSLQSARTLIVEVADGTKTSASDISANQIQIDTILRAIDTKSHTEFNGRRLLDGSSGFRTSGVDTTKISDVDIVQKQTADDVTVSINITTQALQAKNDYQGGTLSAATTLTVTGPGGAATVSLNNGDDTQAIADAFNKLTYATGITATKVDASRVDFATVDYGTRASISITATQGTFALTTSGTVKGTDAVATINGQTVTGDGSVFNVNTSALSAVVKVDPTTGTGAISSFTVSGEGLNFVIGSSPGSTARVGLPSFSTAVLGGVTGKLSSVLSGGSNTLTGGKAAEALKIIDDAISEVTRGRAVIGGFQKYTLDSASRVLAKQSENLSLSLSAIQDTDVAVETAQLSNNLLLQQSAFQALSITTLQNQGVLNLLSSAASRF